MTTGERREVEDRPDANLFCSAHSFLPDGRLLVTGGHVRDNANPSTEGIGEDDLNVFNYLNDTWTRVGLMPNGRWYPSNVTLASGETFTASGAHRNATGAITINRRPDLFRSDGTVLSFTDEDETPLYPYLHLAPNGKVFVAGRGPSPTKYFDPWTFGGLFTDVAFLFFPHREGSSVLYDSARGKVLNVGGRQALAGKILVEAAVIDLSDAAPVWRQVDELSFGRKYHTATVLPDGRVLVTGGSRCTGANDIACIDGQGAAQSPELWDPGTEVWTTMAPSPARDQYPLGIPRVYHSVALLLPDARVLVGGGGLPAAGGEVVPMADGSGLTETCQDATAPSNPHCRVYGHPDAEIFSPPYLFTASGTEAPRPSITTAPPTISHGQSFNVGTDSASQIGSAVLVRLPTVTHGFNFDQRRVVLKLTATSSTNLSVTAPADGCDSPPGPYMLFLVNTSGVPSMAEIVKVLPTPNQPCAPISLEAAADPAPTVNLTWGAVAGNVDHYAVERAPTRHGPFSVVDAHVTGTVFTDTTAATGVTYVYRVRAVGPTGASSGFSNADIATTVPFTDEPLTGGVPIKAEHMMQLRQAVNAVRVAAGLPTVGWTDPNLSTATLVRALHMQELRASLDPALSLLGLPVSPYLEPVLTPGFTPFRRLHWQEIRNRVR